MSQQQQKNMDFWKSDDFQNLPEGLLHKLQEVDLLGADYLFSVSSGSSIYQIGDKYSYEDNMEAIIPQLAYVLTEFEIEHFRVDAVIDGYRLEELGKLIPNGSVKANHFYSSSNTENVQFFFDKCWDQLQTVETPFHKVLVENEYENWKPAVIFVSFSLAKKKVNRFIFWYSIIICYLEYPREPSTAEILHQCGSFKRYFSHWQDIDFSDPHWFLSYYHFIGLVSFILNSIGIYFLMFNTNRLGNFKYCLLLFQANTGVVNFLHKNSENEIFVNYVSITNRLKSGVCGGNLPIAAHVKTLAKLLILKLFRKKDVWEEFSNFGAPKT
nr:hypothetical protein D2062.11 - Caenorhabditis elegans [Caenorhabditis elegans]